MKMLLIEIRITLPATTMHVPVQPSEVGWKSVRELINWLDFQKYPFVKRPGQILAYQFNPPAFLIYEWDDKRPRKSTTKSLEKENLLLRKKISILSREVAGIGEGIF